MLRTVINSIKWELIGKIINQGVGFLITLILSRLLFPEDFGLLSMVFAFTSISNAFVNAGFSSAIIQAKEVNSNELTTVFYFNIIMGVSMGLLFYSLSPYISIYYDNGKIENIAKILSISFIINSLGLVSLAQLQKEFQFKKLTIIRIISGSISGIVGVSLALLEFGVWALVIQTIINDFMRSTLAVFFAKFKPYFHFNVNDLKKLWKFGSHMFLGGLISSIYLRIDYLILGKFFSPVTLGFFFRAKSFRNLIIQYSNNSLGKVLFPVFSLNQDNVDWIKSSIEKSLILCTMVTLFISGNLFISSEEVFILLFSEKWLDSVPYFNIIVIASVAYPIKTVIVNALNGLGHSKVYLKFDILEKIGLTLSISLGIYTANFSIYLIAEVITQNVIAIIYLFKIKSLIGFNFNRFLKYCLNFMMVILVTYMLISFIDLNTGSNFLIQILINSIIFSSLFFAGIFLNKKSFIKPEIIKIYHGLINRDNT